MELPTYTKTFHRKPYPSISPFRPELSTKGKNVVITGGGTGVGAATAIAFAQSGASNIALLGRTEKTLLETKKAVDDAYPETKVHTFVSDLTDFLSLENALKSFSSAVGSKLHILVANAGALDELKPVLETDESNWWSIFEINVKGQYNLVKAFLPLAVDDAFVINVSSCVAHFPTVPKHSSYHASKIAAIKLFDYLQVENPSLVVMQFHPGAIATNMSQKSFDSGIPKGESDDSSLPAAFAVWCVSPEARFLKGKFLWANWDVDELKAKAQELENSSSLTIGLLGWP